MSFLSRLSSLWDADPEKIREKARTRPHIIETEIDKLERALVQGDSEEQAAAAEAIYTAVSENTTIGETLDVFQVILQNANSENPDVRKYLVPTLGTMAPIVSGDAQQQLIASTHILTGLLDREDQYTINQAQPAITRAVREYPDPFLDYVDTIAHVLESTDERAETSATETLGVIAEQHSKLVRPHINLLLEQIDSSDEYRAAEALRTVALVAANTPSVIEDTDYIYTLKWMHDSENPIYEQYAVQSIGYLLSSAPSLFRDDGLLPLLKESLQQHHDRIQKEAAISCLRIIYNTNLGLLDDPDTAHDISYSVNKYSLEEEIRLTDKVMEDIRAATTGGEV